MFIFMAGPKEVIAVLLTLIYQQMVLKLVVLLVVKRVPGVVVKQEVTLGNNI